MDDVIRYYTEQPDEERLTRGWGQLEFARSKEIILRYLPQDARVVLDVGGGTGVYADWLGQLGYDAHLIDVTPSHIDCARSKPSRIASAEVGDARYLSWKNNSADAVMLFGPLYHLTDASGRALALCEARRVLRPGGILFASAICRFAPLLGSLMHGFFDDAAFAGTLARDLQEGQHRNPSLLPDRFTTAYFHRPEELVEEMQASGFEAIELLPVEGPCWLAMGSEARFDECWSNPARRDKLMELARQVEGDPMALPVSPHLMSVGRA